MMKAVLLSIRPEWCERIANGKKTIEVRKTRPKIDTPFKCYIYCSGKNPKWENQFWVDKSHNENAELYLANGKVFGEFVCDEIYQYTSKYGRPKWQEEDMTISDEDMEAQSCMTQEELFHYENFPDSYKWGLLGWHISNLVIYDEPKELSEFCFPPDKYCEKELCGGCPYDESPNQYGEYQYDCEWQRPIQRPPQSWCYVEDE